MSIKYLEILEWEKGILEGRKEEKNPLGEKEFDTERERESGKNSKEVNELFKCQIFQ